MQVNWILQTARIKEEFFNEKVNMVLSGTAETLGADKEACREMGACMEMDSTAELAARLSTNEARKIDSLLNYYMNLYSFHIDYSFKIIKPRAAVNGAPLLGSLYPNQAGSYRKSLAEVANENGLELKLIFPGKTKYIVEEMGVQFVTSVILILVVLVLFLRTVKLLTREKKLSDHTTDFLNNMTHEFKTPLTNIALAGKMIVKGPDNKQEDKIKYYSEIILEENEKLRLQVEQVLSMTALERGEIPLQKAELNFHKVIQDSLKRMSVQLENKQGNMKLALDAEIDFVEGDKIHLMNAFCNLVDNAIKYSAGNPELSVCTRNAGQDLIILVEDKGIGIEKEYHKKVFDKFFRVPTGNIHDVRGFGLGLAYVRKIIELHGGTIKLESEKGGGTTFTITLPNVRAKN